MQPGSTRYFDYILTRIHEYEGFLNIEWTGLEAVVSLRISLTELLEEEPLHSWGSIALVSMEDERDDAWRGRVEHRVEDFTGYVLSRNLPPEFSIKFENQDPPAGYIPADFEIDFFETASYDTSSFYPMVFSTGGDVATVGSCDRECLNMFSFLAYPKERGSLRNPWGVRASEDLFDHLHSVHLSTQSAIMGDNDGLDTCLANVKESESPPGLVIFIDSCTSRLIGQDLVGPVQRFKSKSDIPIVHYETYLPERQELATFKKFWSDVFPQLAITQKTPDSSKIALLGFPPESLFEIRKLFGKMDLQIHSCLYPTLSIRDLKAFPECGVFLLNDWEFIQRIFHPALDTFQQTTASLPLPFGIQGSEKFYEHVAEITGRKFVGDPEIVDAAKRNFENERSVLKNESVAFFLRYKEAQFHLSDRGRFGLPLVDFMHEIGLRVKLYLFLETDANEPDERWVRSVGLDPENGDTVRCYGHWREMIDLLNSNDFRFVYTEVFRDQRVTKAGKIPLTFHHLQPGFSGAVRTARLLKLMIRSDFYKRYNSYLPDAYAHIDAIDVQE